jgi:hypothetical protein
MPKACLTPPLSPQVKRSKATKTSKKIKHDLCRASGKQLTANPLGKIAQKHLQANVVDLSRIPIQTRSGLHISRLTELRSISS